MIDPLVPFGMRGVIWYQGETNVMYNDKAAYYDKMHALVNGWRQVWGEGEFPFYYVELAPFLYTTLPTYKADDQDLPMVWQAQVKALDIPHSGMAATTDLVDDIKSIHPIHKVEVGERLALWALKNDYGKSDIVCCGPLFKSVDAKDGKLVVHFEHADKGLKSLDGKDLSWFTVAGSDGAYVPADAKVDGDTVVVTSDKVNDPKSIRFGWDEAAQPNLANGAGLPAFPFEATVK